MTRALLVLVLLAGRALADAPSIDAAIADAAAAKKMLVIEFGAQWCKPCRWFEQNILPKPDVVEALKGVVFVRYDVDTPIGSEAAGRYKVRGYPTFLVVDNSVETFRMVGFPPGQTKWFLDILKTGKSAEAPIERARAEVLKNPDDLQAKLALARLHTAESQFTEALEQLRAVRDHEKVDPIVAAEAQAEIEEIEAAQLRITTLLDAAEVFVEQHAYSPIASERLALLVMARRKAPDALERVIVGHIAAVRPVDRPNAVRVALLANMEAHARSALASFVDGDRRALALMRAEIELFAGKPEEAKRLVVGVCSKEERGLEAWCLAIVNALRSGTKKVPGVERLRLRAQTILTSLRDPAGFAGHGDLEDVETSLANAIARVFVTAERTCRPLAGRTPSVSVLLMPSVAGGAPKVAVSPDSNEVGKCVYAQLAKAPLPASTTASHVHMVLYFAGAQERAMPDSKRIDSGFLPLAIARVGAFETMGIGVDSFLDVTRIAQFRLTASVELEGGYEDRQGGGTVYAARGLVGLAHSATSRTVIAIRCGLGVGKIAESVPRALEAPLEMRLRVRDGSLTGHLWLRSTYVSGAESREPENPALGDELTFGAAFASTHFYVGVAYEHRAVGSTTMLTAGFPVGGFF